MYLIAGSRRRTQVAVVRKVEDDDAIDDNLGIAKEKRRGWESLDLGIYDPALEEYAWSLGKTRDPILCL